MEYKDIVLPDYNHCILGTITSILKYYNVNTLHESSKVLDELLSEKRFRNIVFIILDGLGEHILNNISKDGYFNENKVDCVTSVYPSTTTAAMTSYYSGLTPYETGWIAWSQYFKEYGRALDMFSQKESYLGEKLKKPILDVFESVVNYETIFERIEKEGNIRAYEVEPSYAVRRSKRTMAADNIDELVDSVADLCSIPGEKFIFAYCDNPDGLLHKYGTDSSEAAEFVRNAENKIRLLRENLEDDTLIIISADHGHKNIEKWYTLLEYPEIMECLIIPPSLESRVLSFWVKEEMKESFVQRFNNVFEKEFWLMTKDEFLNKYKFLGTGNKHSKIDDFIGNYVALSVGSSMIRLETFLAEGKPIKRSTHCGLSKEEMEVPIIVLMK